MYHGRGQRTENCHDCNDQDIEHLLPSRPEARIVLVVRGEADEEVPAVAALAAIRLLAAEQRLRLIVSSPGVVGFLGHLCTRLNVCASAGLKEVV